MRWTNTTLTQFLATGFGSGYLPKAPGTWGTLVAVPIYLLLAGLSWWTYLLIVALMFAVGIFLCGQTATDLQVPDHPSIVWDEIVGYLITMFAIPPQLMWTLVGFGLFRFFDILKPWPIKYCDQNIKGGFGIMLDDVLAGVIANLVLQLLRHYFLV